jgi:lipopolysaccharide/colanic/teichoic acid biosynthesis glycosyltransferase
MKPFSRDNHVNGHASAPRTGLPFWKRALDISCIIVAAPLLFPVMLGVAALIKIVSPGPALFRQERVGFRGRRFTCFKFRTMVVNADTRVHQGHLNYLMDSNVPMKKLDSKGDSRLIPCALLLRSLGLDELPQVFNILRGDMSLVGPRPCVPYEYESYAAEHRRRFDAVPGLTGLWQVSGKNRTTFEQMIQFDVDYARNKSLLLDLKIIFKTVPAIISQTRDLKEPSRPEVARPLPRTTLRQT